MSAIKIEYNGVEIVYVEDSNKWEFTLRGRDRTAESLSKAKEAIDKPVPADKGKPFERVKAIKYSTWKSEFIFGEVTSIADKTHRDIEFWFVSEDGKREKVQSSMMMADTQFNRDVIEHIKVCDAQIKAIKNRKDEHCNSMQKLDIVIPE